MEKPRRSLEDNRRISITCIVILIIILITWIFLLIYILFSKAETKKKINSVNNEIQTITFEGNEILDKEEEINSLLNIVSNPSVFLDTQKENYERSLVEFEDKIRGYEIDKKIAYLVLIVDKTDSLDKTIDILNNNNVLVTFFTNNIEAANKVSEAGHLVGLYVDDEKVVDVYRDEYQELFDSYNPDLYMLSDSLKEKEVILESMNKVTENSTSEGKKFINQEAYINDIVETTADRDFLVIRINLSNSVGVNSIDGIINKLKDKNYIFLPLISSSSLIENN